MHCSGVRRCILAVVASILVMPRPGYTQKLLAELPMPDQSSTYCCGGLPVVVVSFCLGYTTGAPDVFPGGAGSAPSNNTLSPALTCGQPAFSSGPTYFDFNATNDAGFAALVSNLTDDTGQGFVAPVLNLDANGNLTGGGVLGGFPEPTELVGASIDFIRLVVNEVSVGGDAFTKFSSWDVVWQFWSGSPLFSGGGQRTEVNDFLRYRNPLEATTMLPGGSTSHPITLVYGPTINAATFKAVLNGVELTGLNPIPGGTETVQVPVSAGRNVLTVSVDGVASNGRIATDRDRLTFIVP